MMRKVMLAAGACVALAGCADAGRGPTDARSAPMRVAASGSITVAQAGRATVAFPASAVTEIAAGSEVGKAARGAPRGGASDAVLPLVMVRDDARGLIARPGEHRRTISMRDDQGAVHHLVALYGPEGGPPRVIQHYVGATLVRVLAMEWEHVRGGWAQRRLHARELRDGRVIIETDARASSLRLASASRGARLRSALGALLAGALMPRAAEAQLFLSECWTEYKNYWKATGALTTAIVAIEVAEETGAATVVIEGLYVGYTAALASAAIAEFDLFLCIENARELANHLNSLDSPTSTTSTEGTSTSSGGVDTGSLDSSCLEGSYAAACTTPFTL